MMLHLVEPNFQLISNTLIQALLFLLRVGGSSLWVWSCAGESCLASPSTATMTELPLVAKEASSSQRGKLNMWPLEKRCPKGYRFKNWVCLKSFMKFCSLLFQQLSFHSAPHSERNYTEILHPPGWRRRFPSPWWGELQNYGWPSRPLGGSLREGTRPVPGVKEDQSCQAFETVLQGGNKYGSLSPQNNLDPFFLDLHKSET